MHLLSNSLQNHMTLAEPVMVGPGKVMVGTGPSRPGSGYTTVYSARVCIVSCLAWWLHIKCCVWFCGQSPVD